MTFQREHRYVVLKIKDIDNALELWERDQLINICNKILAYRKSADREPLECVVVESDWECYSRTWELVEDEYMKQKEMND